MSVPAPKRQLSRSEYVMQARLLAGYLMDLCEHEPKRRDTRLNNPMCVAAIDAFKYANSANNLRVKNDEDYRAFKRNINKSVDCMDTVEALVSIWQDLQEKKCLQIKDPEKQDKFRNSYENVIENIADMIVRYRDSVEHTRDMVYKAYKKISNSKAGN